VAAIALTGATPVLIDADDHSYLIDEAQIRAGVDDIDLVLPQIAYQATQHT
jgi:dTDP-4-amino-4,6-dideoxygalactose transaminase